MPELEYFLVAESISVDQETNRVSIFNVLEELQADSVPFVYPSLIAISSWNLAEDELGGDFQVMLRVNSPAQESPFDYPINLSRERRRRHRIYHRLIGPSFHAFGDLKFEVLLNGEHRASHIISLIQSDDKDPQG
jgi:hypothetical protein